MNNTDIEWTDYSWNPVVGCSKKSAGCNNCYALRMAVRLAHNPKLSNDAREKYKRTVHIVNGKWQWTEQLSLFPERLEQPLKMRKPKRIFVCSMSDLFHESVPPSYIGMVLSMMKGAHRHTFQVLTKRPERMLELTNWLTDRDGWPNNVWLGVTAENQKRADERISVLRQIPAAVRFVSVEPMLEPVAISQYLRHEWIDCMDHARTKRAYSLEVNWVICGAETGPGARYMDLSWARGLRDQCKKADVPFFMKKVSSSTLPDDLMTREFPA